MTEVNTIKLTCVNDQFFNKQLAVLKLFILVRVDAKKNVLNLTIFNYPKREDYKIG